MEKTPLTDPASSKQQYATTHNLETRRSVWHAGPDGRSPHSVIRERLEQLQPKRLLDVGAGTGAFLEQARGYLDGETLLVGVDISPAMVEASQQLGLDVKEADVISLPFEDDIFDVVTAQWVLYHVADFDKAMEEIKRVLAPGGTFIAATNGHKHLVGLRNDANLPVDPFGFSSEDGAERLRRHFHHVEQIDVETRAIFPNRDTAAAYLETMGLNAEALGEWTGERRYAGFTTVFVCTGEAQRLI